jgi:predicted transposase/invertase (TIGR01784 family)
MQIRALYIPEEIYMAHVQFTKDDRIIDICQDNVFKAIFTKDTPQSRGALKNLVSAILERNIEVITITANEPPANDIHDRQIRYDIAVKMDGGELANVEMTLNPLQYENLRLEYYQARFFVTQDIHGKDKSYNDLKHTWQISLVNKDMFTDPSFIHEFEYYDKKREVSLHGRNHITVLELSKVEHIAEKPVREMSHKERWAVFFRYCTRADKRDLINELLNLEEGIAMAGETILTVSQDEREWVRLENEFRNELDWQAGIAEARQAGLAEGEQKKQELIKNLRELGVPEETIRAAVQKADIG